MPSKLSLAEASDIIEEIEEKPMKQKAKIMDDTGNKILTIAGTGIIITFLSNIKAIFSFIGTLFKG